MTGQSRTVLDRLSVVEFTTFTGVRHIIKAVDGFVKVYIRINGFVKQGTEVIEGIFFVRFLFGFFGGCPIVQ